MFVQRISVGVRVLTDSDPISEFFHLHAEVRVLGGQRLRGQRRWVAGFRRRSVKYDR